MECSSKRIGFARVTRIFWEEKRKRRKRRSASNRRYEFRAARRESRKERNEWNIPRFDTNETKRNERKHFGKEGGRERSGERERERGGTNSIFIEGDAIRVHGVRARTFKRDPRGLSRNRGSRSRKS